MSDLLFKDEIFKLVGLCMEIHNVLWDKILLEAKAVEKLTEAHIKQVLNYLAASKIELGLLVNFGSDTLEWKRVILGKKQKPDPPNQFRL